MRTLLVSVTEEEYDQLGILQEQLSFADMVDLVRKEIGRRAMNRCAALTRQAVATVATDSQDESAHQRVWQAVADRD